MKKTTANEPWRDPAIGPCACSQLRRTSRAVSALYDDFLSPADLTVTQYALLVSIARSGAIQRTQLSGELGMERTTLTRNLRPLEREGWVAERAGVDRREHMLYLTASGRRRLEKGFTCWTNAQQAFLQQFGSERMDELRTLLLAAANVSRSTTRPVDHAKKS